MSTSSKENTNKIFEDIKINLTKGVNDRKHAFHTPVFSNFDNENIIDSRIVVLRKFDPKKMLLNFHTDYRSPKVKSLFNNNNSFFVFYDHKLKIQLRIRTISKINNQNNITKEMWDQTKLFSRKCYLTLKSPSSLTDKPEDGIDEKLKGKEPSKEESENGYKNFTVIENQIKQIDWLFLNANGHKRLKITMEENNSIFNWLIP